MLTWLDPYPTRGMAMSKGEETLAIGKDLWSVPTAWSSWGRVRFAPNIDTQHSQKGDSDPLWSKVIKSFPFIGYACAGPLLGIRASLSMHLMSLFLSKDCSPHSGRVTFHIATLTLACLLSPLAITQYSNCIRVQMGKSRFDIYLLYLTTFLEL